MTTVARRASDSPGVYQDRKREFRNDGDDLDRVEEQRLVRRVEALIAPWEQAEPDRRKRDRIGARLWRGKNSLDGFTDTKLMINSMTPTAIADRVAADVMRASPTPEIMATNSDEEDAARLAEGAILTNWKNTRMDEKRANAYRQSMFTRQLGFYHYWREDLLDGIGDVDKRKIDGHRLIFDNRPYSTQDMKFLGFEEPMSRAELITLFPRKVNEIERAMEASEGTVTNRSDEDPLEEIGGKGNQGRGSDRLVTTASTQTPPYTPVTSITTNLRGGRGKGDPLSEKVMVRYLWIRDYSVKRAQKPRLDPRSKAPMYELERDDAGRMAYDHDGHDVVDTVLGPQYIPKVRPRVRVIMDDCLVPKYPQWRHVVYVKGDRVLLWDVAWDGPVPVSILRDRYPGIGFHAEGTALRLGTLSASRNVLWTIILERLRKSLKGTWLTTPSSGLRRNNLTNEIGAVYTVNQIDSVKEFPVSPLEPGYFQLLQIAESEMEMLLGVTPMMQGQAVGRADSPQTYEQIANQSGGPILDRAKIIDQWIKDAVTIDLWFMQNRYTHEHVVQAETAEGFAVWTQASSLAIRGKFAVDVETGSTLGRSTQRDRQDAEEGANLGFYPLPMLGKLGRFPHWRKGLKMKGEIMAKGPQYSWLLGPAAAPPAQQAMNIRAKTNRSHHRPGGK